MCNDEGSRPGDNCGIRHTDAPTSVDDVDVLCNCNYNSSQFAGYAGAANIRIQRRPKLRLVDWRDTERKHISVHAPRRETRCVHLYNGYMGTFL